MQAATTESNDGATPRRGRRVRRAALGVIAFLSVIALAVAGFAGYEYWRITRVTSSGALGDVGGSVTPSVTPSEGASSLAGQNVLLIGLDSRSDENGKALSPEIYDALHAGDQSIGGLNGNVLMVVHFPADGGPANIVSIPRDDFVDLPGCPDGQCKGKIKLAYGLGHEAQSKKQVGHTNGRSDVELEQERRDAGRAAQVRAVQAFLGGIHIDHFVEVTMVAFYEVAQAVQPITVCVNERTVDTFSGADFVKGRQQIDAKQALAFVRQRRDTSNAALNWSDLDRERRQQAFIASLAYQLRQTGTLANPATLDRLVGVASRNMAVDSGLDLLTLAREARSLDGGGFSLYTLPVARFGTDIYGEDANFADPVVIHALAKRYLTDDASGHPSGDPTPADAATTTGSGTASDAPTPGTPAPTRSGASPSAATPTTAHVVPTPVAGTASPAPTDLSVLGSGGIPYVK